jgi:hypothetical protein
MAILSAIPAMLEGNDFSTAAGKAFGAYAQGRSEGNKANKASQRAAAKELLGLASGRRQEKIGYLKDAQAESAALDKAIREGDKEAIDLILKKAQIGTRLAQATRPQAVRGGGRNDNSVNRNLFSAMNLAEKVDASIDREKKAPAYLTALEDAKLVPDTPAKKARVEKAQKYINDTDTRLNTRKQRADDLVDQYQPGGKAAPKTTAAPKFEEGKIYVDGKGNRAKYTNGKWEPQ